MTDDWRRWLLLLVAIIFASSSELAAQQSTYEYTLGTGDKVQVTVFGEEDLSGEFEIGASGFISLPLIGEVRAAGLSERGLEKAIVEKFLDGFLRRPQVSVEVLNYRPFYILGEVKKPGSYPFVNGMAIVNAVAMGGGFTYRADEKNIILTRASDPDQNKVKVDFRTPVFPGDVIKVEERFF